VRPRIWRKPAVICAAFIIPHALSTRFLLNQKRIRIDFATSELAGTEYLRPLSRLLEDVSVHRNLVDRPAGVDASPDDASPGAIAALEARVDAGFGRLAEVDQTLRQSLETTSEGLGEPGRSASLPAALAAEWRKLAGAGRAGTEDATIG
jgi:hypothetical protein